MGLQHKDLISINQLTKAEVEEILTLARKMRQQVERREKTEDLKDITVINLFYENST